MRQLTLFLALAVLGTIATGSAVAAVGDLQFASVAGDPQRLNGAKSLAVHPDGSDLYAAAPTGSSVVHLRRAANGALTVQDCLGAAAGCTAQAALSGAWRVALGADGSDLYALGSGADAVVHMKVDPSTRAISFADCVGNTGANGCAAVGSLDEPSGIAVTPDGRNVIVSARTSNALLSFDRSAGGALTLAQCFHKTGAGGCTATGDDGLSQADAVSVSPDGTRVYVTGEQSVLRWFTRDPATGTLTSQPGCLGGLTCTSITQPISSPIHAFATATGVYVAAYNGDGVSFFTHAPGTGALMGASCLATGGTCAHPPGGSTTLDGAFEVIGAPDGVDADIASQYADTITVADRDAASGALTFRSCLSEAALPPCTDLAAPGVLDGARGVALSADGAWLFTAAENSDAVAAFRRRVAPVCRDVALTATAGADAAATLACSEANGDPYTIEVVDPPAHGTLSTPGADGAVVYRADPAFAGSDSARFRAADADGASALRTLSVTVAAAPVSGGTDATAGPAPTSAPAPPPASDTTAPRLRPAARRLRVDARGRIALGLSCPNEPGGCRGTLALRVGRTTVGKATFTVPAGRMAKLRIRLASTARVRLRRTGSLKVALRATVRDAAGNRATPTATLTILPVRRRG